MKFLRWLWFHIVYQCEPHEHRAVYGGANTQYCAHPRCSKFWGEDNTG